MDDELVTIAAAAKRLGLSRPRLSAYIKDSGLQKVSKNGVQLVAYGQVCSLVQTLSAQGKMRVHGATRRDSGHGAKTKGEGPTHQLFDQMNRLFERLQDENEKLRAANDNLAGRVRALEAENSQLKLLPAGQDREAETRGQTERGGFLKNVLRKSKAISQAIRD